MWVSPDTNSEKIQQTSNYVIDYGLNWIIYFPDNASKRCMSDGRWFVHSGLNRTWTNYTACFNPKQNNNPSMVPNIVQVCKWCYCQVIKQTCIYRYEQRRVIVQKQDKQTKYTIILTESMLVFRFYIHVKLGNEKGK